MTSVIFTSIDFKGKNSTNTLSSTLSGFGIAIEANFDNRSTSVFSAIENFIDVPIQKIRDQASNYLEIFDHSLILRIVLPLQLLNNEHRI